MTAVESAAFDAFDQANPEIWDLFVVFTMDRINLGYSNFSARAILHRIRWESGVGAAGGFKIDNNTSPWYARKFHQAYPRYAGFFRMREVKRGITPRPLAAAA